MTTKKSKKVSKPEVDLKHIFTLSADDLQNIFGNQTKEEYKAIREGLITLKDQPEFLYVMKSFEVEYLKVLKTLKDNINLSHEQDLAIKLELEFMESCLDSVNILLGILPDNIDNSTSTEEEDNSDDPYKKKLATKQ